MIYIALQESGTCGLCTRSGAITLYKGFPDTIYTSSMLSPEDQISFGLCQPCRRSQIREAERNNGTHSFRVLAQVDRYSMEQSEYSFRPALRNKIGNILHGSRKEKPRSAQSHNGWNIHSDCTEETSIQDDFHYPVQTLTPHSEEMYLDVKLTFPPDYWDDEDDYQDEPEIDPVPTPTGGGARKQW